MLSQWGRNSFDDAGASMLTSVNYYAEGNNNAYWNGNQIVIWSWSSGWRSLAGCPDVIAHEWGHAVTDYCSDLVYQLEPGALNESFSDMMGAAFEWAHPTYDTPDWYMGENGMTSGNGFRSMDNPHMFGDPDFYGTSDPYWVDVVGCTPSWTNDYCGVHTNSGVGNKWFSLLSDGGVHHSVTVTGIGVDNAMLIAYRANQLYWNSQTDYHAAALGTISAATDLDPTGVWTTQVANAWNAVGVSTPGPSLTFSYPSGVPSIIPPETPQSFEIVINGTLGGEMVTNSGYLHYSLDGGAYIDQPLQVMTSTRFKGTLPSAPCESMYEFYVSAEEVSSGIKYDPDPSSPHTAIVADSVIYIFEDDCETDLGWTVSGNATDGQWERGIPVGGGDRGDPPTDYDGSGYCYLTDNVDDNSDVDDGTTYLDSPIFDLSDGDAEISYARWYSNNFGASPYADEMKVHISNNAGGGWTLVETIGPTEQASGGWYTHSFWASAFVTPTDQMMLRFEASDLGEGSVVEAGVDAVKVSTFSCGFTPGPLDITTESVPDWTAGHPYSVQLEATGGIGMYMWSDKNGDLFGTGLSLSVEGLLSGTVTEPMVISFTAEVTDEEFSTDEVGFLFTINESLSITTLFLPDWTEGVPYSQMLETTGGTGLITWSDRYSDLVGTGLTLDSGVILGTPVAGPVSFTAEATDYVGASAESPFSFTINVAPDITTSALPEAEDGKPYSEQLQSTGGTGAITWTDRDGDLSGTGLALSTDGLLSGTPSDTGTINFIARIEDAVGGSDEMPLTLIVVQSYVCGDANGDEGINVADAVFMISYVFKDGPAPDPLEAGDANCDGDLNIADGVYIINHVFKDGPEPCCP
jgi:hypothetical protein